MFRFGSFPDQSAYAWQIWSLFGGRVEKKGALQTYTHRHKGTNDGNDSEHFIMPPSLHFMIWLRLIDSESFLFNLHIFYNKLKPVCR